MRLLRTHGRRGSVPQGAEAQSPDKGRNILSVRFSPRLIKYSAWLTLAVVLAGCASQPLVLPDNLSAGEIFQRAQEAVEKGDYELGIGYYTLFKEKHPEDRERGAWASYEIAFLYHKMGKDDTALSLTDELLALYAKEGDSLPQAPKILAMGLKNRLSEKTPPSS